MRPSPATLTILLMAMLILPVTGAAIDEPGSESFQEVEDPARDALIGALVLELELISAMARAHISLSEIARISDHVTRVEMALGSLMYTPTPRATSTLIPTVSPTRTPAPSSLPTRTAIVTPAPKTTPAAPPWPTPKP